MDKRLKLFISSSALIILIFFLAIFLVNLIYRYSTIITYNYMLLFIMSLLIILMIALTLSAFSIYYVYRFRRVNPLLVIPVKVGLKIFLPFITLVTGLVKEHRDIIRDFYISVNNILVLSGKVRFKPDQVLILLPHCLQNTECNFKITNNIHNCKRCGRCRIGDILKLAEQNGIFMAVVTGGTAARNIVSERKPKLILSVACERDLFSGIMDVSKIPVIGIVNERPNGPCINTLVNVDAISEKLLSIIDIKR